MTTNGPDSEKGWRRLGALISVISCPYNLFFFFDDFSSLYNRYRQPDET